MLRHGIGALTSFDLGVPIGNLAFNCNLPATVLFAKAGDTLRYKPVVFPLYPDTGKALDNIAPDKILSTAAIMLESASDR